MSCDFQLKNYVVAEKASIVKNLVSCDFQFKNYVVADKASIVKNYNQSRT